MTRILTIQLQTLQFYLGNRLTVSNVCRNQTPFQNSDMNVLKGDSIFSETGKQDAKNSQHKQPLCPVFACAVVMETGSTISLTILKPLISALSIFPNVHQDFAFLSLVTLNLDKYVLNINMLEVTPVKLN